MKTKNIRNLIVYILLILVIVIIFVLICHYISLNKINSEIEILQAETPDFNIIQGLINQNQPTVFRQVLYGWEPIIHIFDAEMDDINYLLDNNKDFNTDILNCLSSYSMFLSFGWEYKFIKKNKGFRDSHFKYQNNYRQLFAQIMGTQRFYLIHPSQKHLIDSKVIIDENNNKNLVSKTNFWNKNETSLSPFNKIEYIEIILREGNILFIPKGWWYLQVYENDSFIFESINLSLFSLLNLNI